MAAGRGERGRGDQLAVVGEQSDHRVDVLARPGPLEGERGQELPGLLLAVCDQALDEQRVAVQLGCRVGSGEARAGQFHDPHDDLLVLCGRRQQPRLEQLVDLLDEGKLLV